MDGLSGCPGEGIKPYHPVAEVRRADASVVVELLLLAVRVGHGRVLALAAWVGLTKHVALAKLLDAPSFCGGDLARRLHGSPRRIREVEVNPRLRSLPIKVTPKNSGYKRGGNSADTQ